MKVNILKGWIEYDTDEAILVLQDAKGNKTRICVTADKVYNMYRTLESCYEVARGLEALKEIKDIFEKEDA